MRNQIVFDWLDEVFALTVNILASMGQLDAMAWVPKAPSQNRGAADFRPVWVVDSDTVARLALREGWITE